MKNGRKEESTGYLINKMFISGSKKGSEEWSEEVRMRKSTPSPSSVDSMRVVSRD